MNSHLYYFGYGANMSLSGMAQRCPGCIPVGRGVLSGYDLDFYLYADIEPRPSAQVYGSLFMITPAHLMALDRFEGYPSFYNRKRVDVVIDAVAIGRGARLKLLPSLFDRQVKAVAYYMVQRRPGPPMAVYLDLMERGWADWQIPKAYQEHIKAKGEYYDWQVD